MNGYSQAEEGTFGERIQDVTGVILAGGKSRRMGRDKALLPFGDERLIDRVHRVVADLFAEVLVVTATPGPYADLSCRKLYDRYPGRGPLAGVHAGLTGAATEGIFVVACDMPFLQPRLIRHLCRQADAADAVVPVGDHGWEPLHALYRRRCLEPIEALLEAGRGRTAELFTRVTTREIPPAQWRPLDPAGRSFCNLNTLQDYAALCRPDASSSFPDR